MSRCNLDTIGIQLRKFNDFVRGELGRQNYTQQNLGDYLGLHASSICYKLSGQVEWSLREFLKTLEFLGADVRDFL